jgi:histidinol-phosphatase
VFDEELAFAHELADRASDIALSFFGGSFEVREKADKTPVTEADVQIERTIRTSVHERYPTDGVLGEEGGVQGEASERRWVVDPIDGTKNFADGVQVWATLIALVVRGEPVVGVVSAPAIGERYDGVTGSGARLNGDPIRVSRADRVGRASILHSSVAGWIDGPYRERLLDLLRESRRDRGFGDFWGHMLVARGSADVMFEPELATWDFAALQVIVAEAGGRMTQFDGSPVLHGGSVLTTNGVLHDELVARLDHSRDGHASSEVR